LGFDDEFGGAVEAMAPMNETIDIDAVFDDLTGEEPEADVGDSLAASSAAVEPDETEQNVGFDEDIFADDFSTELALGVEEVGTDINAVFPGIAPVDNSFDAICGVDVDEFADNKPLDDLTSAHSVEDVVDTLPEEPGLAWFIPQGISFNHTGPNGAEIFTDFLDAFIEEGSAEVEKLEDAFGEWEKDATVESALAPIARTLHTIKGIAKGVGLQRYGTLVHNFETLLEARSCPEAGAEQDYFRMMNIWLDAVVRGVEYVQEQRADIASEFPVQGQRATDKPAVEEPVAERGDESSAEVNTAPAKQPEAVARHSKQDKQLADEGAKALAAQQSVRITSEKLDHLLNLTSQAQQLGVRSSQSTSRGKRASAELQGRLSSVRTHIAKIADRALLSVNARGGRSTPDMDALEMDQYSELQEAASILREGVEDLADLVEVASRQNALVEALLKQQSSVISSITSSIQSARVVPVSRLMPGLRRLVRTVSTDLDKAVSLQVLNEVGALDRDHYSRCQVILEHMVRNALDHGIETPQERLEMGKPTAGRITIDVRKSGGDYIIKLADDGRGIDPEAIRESAYEKGLDIDADALSDAEAIRLIFHKGFSTANTVSEISGRGVGMDIVMSELQQLGGDVQIQSAIGLGTSFELRIPSNVSVNGALFVNAGESAYAIPLNGLIAVEHVAVDEFYSAVERGETLSLFDMECEPAYLATLCQGESLPDRSVWGATLPVIIAGSEQRHMAIAIDSVEEALELVVRSLGAQFSSVPGVAGAATTADGEAIVALDLNLLVASVVSGDLAPVAVSREADTTLLALVVDDSRTQRMVATSQLDTVGVETVTAENGMVAIDLLNATHRLPDIVLLDVEMPVKDGIETLREIRKSLRYGHLPVIMVTSRTGAKHRAMAREAGCNGYMGKPFNFPGLVEQISELTGHELQLS
jgi:chemosensory pili system protein ChpA (sensor histidine kinase/response regulator)